MPDLSHESILTLIKSPIETYMNEGFAKLFDTSSIEAAACLDNLVKSKTETVVKIRLCGYIKKEFRGRRGLEVLVKFMEDGNAQLFLEAKEAFQDVECPGKKDVILSMLNSTSDNVVDFAIKAAGKRRIFGAVDVFSQLLENGEKDRKLLIIRALKKISATGSIPILYSQLDNPDDKIVYETIQALGMFSKYISWSKISKYFYHDSPAVRKAVIWFLMRYKAKSIRNLLLDKYFVETDVSVRNEIIEALQHYRDFKILVNLLFMSANGETNNVKILADSALNRFPEYLVYKMVKKYRKNKDDKIRLIVMHKASMVLSKKNAFKWLVDTLKHDISEQVRVAAAESLRHYEGRAAVSYLEHSFLFDKSTVVRYTSLLSLTHLWKEQDIPTICSILEFPLEKYAHIQVCILRFLEKKVLRNEWDFPEKLYNMIMFLLYSDNLEIRYLAMQIVRIVKDKKAFIPIIDIYLETKIREEKEQALNTIQEIVYSDPEFYLAFLLQAKDHEKLFASLLEIFEKIEFEPEMAYEMILQFSALFLSEKRKRLKRRLAKTIVNIFKREYSQLPMLVEQENWHWVKIILECSKYTKQDELRLFGADIFMEHINSYNDEMQKIAIIMAGSFQDERAIDDLTRIAITNKSKEIKMLAKVSINQILNGEDNA